MDNPAGGGDAPAQSDSATRWLSYDEIAAARGIDRESAVRWSRRKRWPRREANDGTVRLAVPEGILRRASNRGGKAPNVLGDVPEGILADVPGHALEDNPGTINALEGHIQTLREELAAARQVAAEVPALAERAGRAEAEAAALRDAMVREVRRLEQTEDLLKAAETQRDAAQKARDASQAELAGWTAGAPLARAWRAFTSRRRP
jgi:hypothetical protein